jgi:hypothetical protein
MTTCAVFLFSVYPETGQRLFLGLTASTIRSVGNQIDVQSALRHWSSRVAYQLRNLQSRGLSSRWSTFPKEAIHGGNYGSSGSSRLHTPHLVRELHMGLS